MVFFLRNKNFIYATAVLIGTMVGVGIFGVPFVFSKSGFWVGFLFLIVLGVITVLMDFMYGEIILRTHGQHQIVGYTQFYLGTIYKKIIFFSVALGLYSALLAYTIIAGEFLSNIFSSLTYVSSGSYSILFFVILSILILTGLKRISWLELILVSLYIFIILIIFVVGFDKINLVNLGGLNREFWFLPYGVMLFAFAGFAGIPIQREILKNQEGNFKKSVLGAVILVGILYLIFAITVLGISGDATSSDALSGLFQFLGVKIIILGSIFGVIAIGTSFLTLGSAFLDIFILDYKFSKKAAWILVMLPPLVLYIGGLRTFIKTISLAGSVALGLEGVILILVYIKSKSRGDRIPEYSLELPKWIYYLLILIFLAGMAYSLFIE